MNIAQELIKWYNYHQRDLPWRKSKDPYKIWLSEIILQQTRVNQGLSYYENFIKRFPKIEDLANASENEVLKLWQGLGYYTRARNLHHTAKYIVQYYNKKFPNSYHDIIKLKGIGEYTAAAIVSFAYGQPFPVIDGNVKRVVSRLFAINKPIDSSDGIREIKTAVSAIFDKNYPAQFNQAIMEFGALQCVPKNPDCSICILKEKCLAFHKKIVHQLPFKEKKTKIKKRFIYYLVIYQKNKLYIKKRTDNDIWRNMYDFPRIEKKRFSKMNSILTDKEFLQFFNNLSYNVKSISQPIKHVLTHQQLFIHFIEIELNEEIKLSNNDFIKIPLQKIQEYPVPIVISNFINEKILK